MKIDRRSRYRRWAAVSAAGTTVALALVGGATAPASPQDADATHPGGWTRFHAEDFERAAGELCPFAVSSEVLFDREYVRTPRTFPDGSPRREEYVGPLVVRVTNTETGRSVRRDLSARGVVTYRQDGSYDFALDGPAAVGFHDGDGYPAGYYVVDGRHTIRFAADGSRQVLVDDGPEENLCETLA